MNARLFTDRVLSSTSGFRMISKGNEVAPGARYRPDSVREMGSAICASRCKLIVCLDYLVVRIDHALTFLRKKGTGRFLGPYNRSQRPLYSTLIRCFFFAFLATPPSGFLMLIDSLKGTLIRSLRSFWYFFSFSFTKLSSPPPLPDKYWVNCFCFDKNGKCVYHSLGC